MRDLWRGIGRSRDVRRRAANDAFDVVFYAPWAAGVIRQARSEADGGAETQIFLVASGLAAAGLRVAMIVTGAAGELPATADGIHILRQRAPRRASRLLARPALALAALRGVAGVRARVLVHRSAGPTVAVLAFVARLRGARFVYSSSSVVDFELAAWEPRRLNVRLFEWGLRRADAIVVQTEEQAQLCRTRFGRDATVIPSVASVAPRQAGRAQAFLWVGRLQPLKRPEAYVELARSLPEARFRMIAIPATDESRYLRRAIEEAVLERPNLELLEPRSRAGVGELLETTVAVVNTSEREGVPNVFLEGWSRGVPALALSFDPDGLIERHGLGLFAGGDPALFEQHARQLWASREDRSEMAGRCLEYIRAAHDAKRIAVRWRELVVGGG